MDNNINPDEVLTDAQIAALEASLSVITDVSRSESDLAQLSESERIQAQTFDKLINLANQGIEFKPVSFTIPSVQSSVPSRSKNYKLRIGALTAAALVLISAVILAPMSLTRIIGTGTNANTSAATDNNSVINNYWSDSFDNQLSEFEGEMICLSANYDNIDVAVDSMYNIDEFSEIGDF